MSNFTSRCSSLMSALLLVALLSSAAIAQTITGSIGPRSRMQMAASSPAPLSRSSTIRQRRRGI